MPTPVFFHTPRPSPVPPTAAAPRGSWWSVNVKPSAPDVGTGAESVRVKDTVKAAVRSRSVGAHSAPACMMLLNALPVVSTAEPGAAQRVARAEPTMDHREKSRAPPVCAHAAGVAACREKFETLCAHTEPPVPAAKPSHADVACRRPARLTLFACCSGAPEGPTAERASVHGKHAE